MNLINVIGILKRALNNFVSDDNLLALYHNIMPAPLISLAYIAIEVTNNCNLRCEQCLYKGGDSEYYKRSIGFMDPELYKDLIDELSRLNCKNILHNADGEATLHPKFLDLLEYATSKGMKIHFNTNGTRFNENFTEKLLSFYKGSLYISLDGFKETHEKIRKGSSYDKVIHNIDYLLEKRNESKCKPVIGVSFCNYNQSLEEREKFIEYWVRKVDVVSVAETWDINTKVVSANPLNNSWGKRTVCQMPWFNFEVSWQGDIIPCTSYMPIAQVDNGIMGNITTNSLKEIWSSEKYRNFRNRNIKFDLKELPCENCERWKLYESYPTRTENGLTVTSNGIFKSYKIRKN